MILENNLDLNVKPNSVAKNEDTQKPIVSLIMTTLLWFLFAGNVLLQKTDKVSHFGRINVSIVKTTINPFIDWAKMTF